MSRGHYLRGVEVLDGVTSLGSSSAPGLGCLTPADPHFPRLWLGSESGTGSHDWPLGQLDAQVPQLVQLLLRDDREVGRLAHRMGADRLSRCADLARYECMVHGIGLEEENPSVCHPQDRQSNADTLIEEDMALVVELYAGEVGHETA